MKTSENSQVIRLSDSVNLVCLNVQRSRYALKKFTSYLSSNNPNIVLTFNNEVVMVEYVVQLFRKRDYILIHRNVTCLSSLVYHSGGGFASNIRYWILKNILRQSDVLVCQCDAMAKDACIELNIPDALPHIYNPVSKSSLSYDRDIYSKNSYILCVGRLDKNKNFSLALNAFALLPQSMKTTKLWLAGDGPEKKNIEMQIEKLNLQNRVRLLGYIDNIDALYYNAALVSLTSHFEGFPNVLIEAISHGCPVVAVDCLSGPSEIIEEGINGFLVKDRAPESLAEAYNKCLVKKWDRTQVALTAKKFSEQVIIEKWDDLLINQLVKISN